MTGKRDRYGPLILTTWTLGALGIAASLLLLRIALTAPHAPDTPRTTPITSISPTDPAQR